MSIDHCSLADTSQEGSHISGTAAMHELVAIGGNIQRGCSPVSSIVIIRGSGLVRYATVVGPFATHIAQELEDAGVAIGTSPTGLDMARNGPPDHQTPGHIQP